MELRLDVVMHDGAPSRRCRSKNDTFAGMVEHDSSSDRESDDERRNRQLLELLNELRVALPGVQMLFGFLLAVPFSQRFATITAAQRDAYYATFISAALASACLIAPTSFHRIVWQRHLKQRLIQMSSLLALVGTAFLAAAITGSVVLVTSIVFGTAAATAVGGLAAGVLIALWYALPLAYRIRNPKVR
jgi:hypothetical protein